MLVLIEHVSPRCAHEDILTRFARILEPMQRPMSQRTRALAFLSPVVALFCAAQFFAVHCRRRPSPERRLPLVAYVLLLLACAILAFPIGTIYGVSLACSDPNFGNLCGLFGFLVTGPIASSLAIILVSALISFLPADETEPPIPADRTPALAKTPWYRKLWRGDYSLARSFWGYFALGAFVGRIIGMNPVFLLLPGAALIYQPMLWCYEIASGVGVWRSANASSTNSVNVIAAKTVVALLVVIHGVLLIRTLVLYLHQ